MKKYYIGVDVGGTKIAYGLFDNSENIIRRYRFPSNSNFDGEALADTILSQINNIVGENNITFHELAGVGVALPSFIRKDEGVILKTSTLPRVKNFPMRHYLQDRLPTEVKLENDGNVAALAEFRKGAGKGFEHMLYCPVSTGCSSAIIINGQIFHGSYGWAGESGHALITPGDGPYCGCENLGCFMSHISGAMIVQRVIQKIESGSETSMLEMVGGDCSQLSAVHILEGAKQNDPLALWAVDHMAYYMGLWLFNLYQILNINCYVFGGGLVNFGDILFGKAFEHFRAYNKNDLPIHFKFAELGNDTGIIGACQLFF